MWFVCGSVLHPALSYVCLGLSGSCWPPSAGVSASLAASLAAPLAARCRSSLGVVYVLSCPATNSSSGRARSLALSLALSGVYLEDP